MRYDDDDEDDRQAPAAVVAAVAVGTIPTPFLAVYAVMFLVHGSVHPVVPPDITNSKGGEFIAGIVAAVLFAVSVIALVHAMGGRRRWPFGLVQFGMLAAAGYVLIDGTKGGTAISVAIILTALVALVLIFLPPAWAYYVRPVPRPLAALVGAPRRRTASRSARRNAIGAAAGSDMPAGSLPVSDAAPAGDRSIARPPHADRAENRPS